ncbi:MAG: 2-amino-4-hydroxy-6-hydroxymethyldihydropteridine diphosphokinase [endosymbiont of Galathealinum brachiosum]|uniref:2-amino-4-hydroxy-6-hydroxymethyldihydropteridine pyrophosphokinase n=1 Tax=endosymbiont of Galathealinum brachiosum TaxID=2200906 RepID=A0A370D9Y0_9GAMM|nr:MAG: 2-amino-4-hydroxy-6-hydroxymethyldihydropteridine diphosphokinase [endosymbiont of Galathealinum brachiosum]
MRCYIGLGSNLNNPLQQLNNAKEKIAELPDTILQQCSSIYQSKALTLDNEPQNDYLNAVIEIETTLTAELLLDSLQQLESEQGRIREKRWGARTIDLDILLYGNQQIRTERLVVPHNEIENRNFVLLPLFQISPELEIPGKGFFKKMLDNVSHQALEKVSEFNGKA